MTKEDEAREAHYRLNANAHEAFLLRLIDESRAREAKLLSRSLEDVRADDDERLRDALAKVAALTAAGNALANDHHLEHCDGSCDAYQAWQAAIRAESVKSGDALTSMREENDL